MSTKLEIFQQTYTFKILKSIFHEILEIIETVGFISSIFLKSIKFLIKGDFKVKEVMIQASKIGVDSLPISLSLVGLCGMIIALQFASEMVNMGGGHFVGSLVTISIIREIGPIMASFGVISMVGSSMAAEIATMKVTEQIDAMKTLKVDPVRHLIAPRILAAVLVLPFVVILANAVGIVGGMFSSKLTANLNTIKYIESVWHGLSEIDIYASLVKAGVFGGLISLISASIGYKARGGAIDVGKATTRAVVWSFSVVVIVDYIISLIFFD